MLFRSVEHFEWLEPFEPEEPEGGDGMAELEEADASADPEEETATEPSAAMEPSMPEPVPEHPSVGEEEKKHGGEPIQMELF